MVPTCSAAAAVNSTEALGQLLGSASSNAINFGADVEVGSGLVEASGGFPTATLLAVDCQQHPQ